MREELKAKIEQLRLEAAECDQIGYLAEDDRKRDLFRKLALDLRSMASDMEATIADHKRSA